MRIRFEELSENVFLRAGRLLCQIASTASCDCGIRFCPSVALSFRFAVVKPVWLVAFSQRIVQMQSNRAALNF